MLLEPKKKKKKKKKSCTQTMYQKFTQKLLPNETEDVQIEPSLRQVGAYAILTGLKGPSPFNSLLCFVGGQFKL